MSCALVLLSEVSRRNILIIRFRDEFYTFEKTKFAFFVLTFVRIPNPTHHTVSRCWVWVCGLRWKFCARKTLSGNKWMKIELNSRFVERSTRTSRVARWRKLFVGKFCLTMDDQIPLGTSCYHVFWAPMQRFSLFLPLCLLRHLVNTSKIYYARAIWTLYFSFPFTLCRFVWIVEVDGVCCCR